MVQLDNDWDEIIKQEILKPYYLQLREFLKHEYLNARVYPPMNEIFFALRTTKFADVKVVILGQDPYINKGEANGMAFSVNSGIKIPPSLANVYKELSSDLKKDFDERGYGKTFDIPKTGYLLDWAKQGVLLLNSCLTVRAGQSKSHKNKGWETFTDFLIAELDKKNLPTVFMLWGNDAKSKADLIADPKHLVLKAAHPSPLAGGAFFGCRHFSKANQFLRQFRASEIDWTINNY